MAEVAAPRLEMRGISKRFGATLALDDVGLSVSPGEVHGLIGENGAGKSTLMKVLSGAFQPDSGRMSINGAPYSPRSPLEARRAGVAMIYQELSLAPHLTVAGNIGLGMEPTAWGFLRGSRLRAQARAALEQLGHPEIEPDECVGRMPIGAQQIVEIARALAVGCRILVLDEPTSSLSRNDVATLFRLITRLKEQGIAIVYISHFLEEVKEVADRFTVLRDGRIAGAGAMAGTTIDSVVNMMVGRQIDELYVRSQRTPGEPILELRDVSGPAKPHSASLTLRLGEVMGIAGLVGAGRTELLRAVFGLDPVRSGEIRLGAYVGPASPARRWLQGAGFLSEDRKNEGLALPLTLADNLTLSRLPWFVSLRQQATASRKWIEALDIRCLGPSQRVLDLSGGNQQKVALARLLHHEVDVFLLDEPTRGVDIGSKALIYRLIEELASRGKAILMVSSYMPELIGVCDRIAVMCRGHLLPPRPAHELTEHELMLEATGGRAA